MAVRTATVFGGSGFIGRYVIERLATAGYTIRVAVRNTESAQFLKAAGDGGQVTPFAAHISDPRQVADAVNGAEVVVNLVGILYERGRSTFQAIHVDGAANVARAAQATGSKSLVHMSALGADGESPAAYGRTKAAGEMAVLAAFPEATILRPSVVFGPEDHFFNLFAGMARYSPVLPVMGCPLWPKITFFGQGGLIAVDFYGTGGSKFQPVYVGDVADAVMVSIARPEAGGKTFELGGPRVYSFKELMELLLAHISRRRLLLPVPLAVATVEAWFLEFLPTPLLTRDQVSLLKRDNVVGDTALTFKDLGLDPTSTEIILPTYLHP